SIGQVHRATLLDGRAVVVKVQRPGIDSVITADLEILLDLAGVAERRTRWGQEYAILDLAEEFARILKGELDYRLEAENIEEFLSYWEGDERIRVPRVILEYSSSKVLALEELSGKKWGTFQPRPDEARHFARLLTELFSEQVLD